MSYLHSLESRSHDAEAVLGILLSVPDQRATGLLSELSKDPFVQSVLDQVNNSAFGPRGRGSTVCPRFISRFLCLLVQDADPFTGGPTNGWQDAIIDKIKAKNGGGDGESFATMQSTLSPPG